MIVFRLLNTDLVTVSPLRDVVHELTGIEFGVRRSRHIEFDGRAMESVDDFVLRDVDTGADEPSVPGLLMRVRKPGSPVVAAIRGSLRKLQEGLLDHTGLVRDEPREIDFSAEYLIAGYSCDHHVSDGLEVAAVDDDGDVRFLSLCGEESGSPRGTPVGGIDIAVEIPRKLPVDAILDYGRIECSIIEPPTAIVSDDLSNVNRAVFDILRVKNIYSTGSFPNALVFDIPAPPIRRDDRVPAMFEPDGE